MKGATCKYFCRNFWFIICKNFVHPRSSAVHSYWLFIHYRLLWVVIFWFVVDVRSWFPAKRSSHYFFLRWQCALHTVVLWVMQDKRRQMLPVKLCGFSLLVCSCFCFCRQVSRLFSDEFSEVIYLFLSQLAPTGFAAPRLTAGSTFIVVQWGKLDFLW